VSYTFASATILLLLITEPLANIPIFANALTGVAPVRARSNDHRAARPHAVHRPCTDPIPGKTTDLRSPLPADMEKMVAGLRAAARTAALPKRPPPRRTHSPHVREA